MKKLALLAAITLMGMSASCWAAVNATVLLNNYDSNIPILYMATPTSTAVPAPVSANVNIQLLGGPDAAHLLPVVVAGGTTSIIPVDGVGFFDGGVGVVPGVTAGATATLQLTAFVGNNPSAAFQATWTQATGKWDDTPPASPPSGVPTLAVPAGGITVGAVPEPSTIALGLLGLGALLIRRRK